MRVPRESNRAPEMVSQVSVEVSLRGFLKSVLEMVRSFGESKREREGERVMGE